MGRKPQAQVVMSYQSVATALVKANDIREGFWRVALTFGQVAGVNAEFAGATMPAAFLPVMGISLVRDDDLTALSVDAAVVNARRVVELN